MDWNQVCDACQAMSLFSARQIIELELPAKVDKDLAARIAGDRQTAASRSAAGALGPLSQPDQMKAAWFDKAEQSVAPMCRSTTLSPVSSALDERPIFSLWPQGCCRCGQLHVPA